MHPGFDSRYRNKLRVQDEVMKSNNLTLKMISESDNGLVKLAKNPNSGIIIISNCDDKDEE